MGLKIKKGTKIEELYEIQFLLGENPFTDTYRAKDNTNKIVRIDIINLAALPSSFFDDDGKLIEINLMRKIEHSNIPKLLDEGITIINQEKYAYLVFEFISGESLTEKLKREGNISPYEAIPIICQILDILGYLHNLTEPVVHNGVTPDAVFIDYSSRAKTPYLIGFEQSRTIFSGTHSLSIKNLSIFHSAPELFNGIFIPKSDIFSVGTLLYQLFIGIPPWYNENIIQQPINKIKKLIEQARERELNFDLTVEGFMDEHLKNTILKALAVNPDERFQSADEFSKALKRELIIDNNQNKDSSKNIKTHIHEEGKGFDLIAGMDELKNILKSDVIDVLNDPDKFKEYGIPLLNGMLLFGPPGCGKTFIAQNFADEVGYNFVLIKPSDLKSKWLNATEENIRNLFNEAEKKAPTVIFIDELDSLVPNRENELHHSHASAVNELLAQMSNCGERGIFIIGATNRPEKIDSAILRTGRLDKLVYVSPPDEKARCTLFDLYLKNRPSDLGIDYEELAKVTNNYVSSDIKFIVDEASRKALKTGSRITMDILIEAIKLNKPSVTHAELTKYNELKKQWDMERENVAKEEKPSVFGFRIQDKNEGKK